MSETITKEIIDTDEFFEPTARVNRKKAKKKGTNVNQTNRLNLMKIKPLTETQYKIFDCFENTDQNLFLHGFAGTGKSFISIFNLMNIMMKNDIYQKLVIIRSTVPSRDQGFLPGNAAEKAKIYENPYNGIFTELFNRGDAYTYLKNQKKVEFESTSYLRGTTYNNCLIYVDEAQNMTYNEAMTVLTRVGENCRIVVSGDFKQTDLKRSDERKDILKIMQIMKRMKSVSFFEFKKEDIVRSGFVKELLIAEDKVKFESY